MARKEFHYRWEYELRSSPQALWPVVADTNRFNRDAGVPAVVDTVSADAVERLHNSRRRLRLSLLGFNLEWEEDPFEWIRPYRFGVVRRYKSGPVAEMRISAELAEREGGGTRLVYQIWATPRGPLGRLVIPTQIGRRAARQFADTFRRYDEMTRDGTSALANGDGSTLNAGERARLERTREKLVADGAREELVARLAETVERGDELTLSRLRPYALADCWNEPRREVLELCLRATRAGLLDFSWELLCPLCRGASQASGSLKDVQSNQHCESCNIDFTVNFDRSVELTFRPNASVRRVEARAFCVGGPLVTPHVVAQQIIPPRSRRTVTPALEEGRHRVRAHNLPGGQFVFATRDGGAREATLGTGGGAWPTEELHVSTRPALTFENASDAEQLFILERTAWNDQAATAAEVTALQLFRDLFAFEALRPGDQINVGQMTILFTDLRGSTQLYREIGDAVAFGAVMSHFDVLKEAIAARGRRRRQDSGRRRDGRLHAPRAGRARHHARASETRRAARRRPPARASRPASTPAPASPSRSTTGSTTSARTSTSPPASNRSRPARTASSPPPCAKTRGSPPCSKTPPATSSRSLCTRGSKASTKKTSSCGA